MKRYFKRNWAETRGDEFDSWGTCTFYFELGTEGIPTKQIELYENGNRLKYHSGRSFDDYGKLGDQPLDLNELGEYEIGKDEFESEWQKANPKTEHQEIINLISDYLANNYSLKFGQALFNLGINEFAHKTNPEMENYRLRDIYNDKDKAILERVKSQLEWFEKQKKS